MFLSSRCRWRHQACGRKWKGDWFSKCYLQNLSLPHVRIQNIVNGLNVLESTFRKDISICIYILQILNTGMASGWFLPHPDLIFLKALLKTYWCLLSRSQILGDKRQEIYLWGVYKCYIQREAFPFPFPSYILLPQYLCKAGH